MSESLNFSNWKKKFFLIWTGQAFSIISSSAVSFALTTWLTLEYKSEAVLLNSALAWLLPSAILSPIAGVYVDRWNKKWTMIISDSLVAIFTVIMAFFLMQGGDQLIAIYILMALRSTASAFHAPSMQASAPLLAPTSELMRVASVEQMIQGVSTIAGPALGGALVAFLPISQILFLDVVGAIIAVTFLAFVKFPKEQKQKSDAGIKQVFTEMKEGWYSLKENRGIFWLFVYGSISPFFTMPVVILLSLIIQKHFGGAELEISIANIAFSIGMILGSLVLYIRNFKTHKAYIEMWSYGVYAILFIVMGLFPSSFFWPFSVLLAIIGITSAITQSASMALMQEKIPQEKLGRVLSLYMGIAMIPSIIGLFAAKDLMPIFGDIMNLVIFSGIGYLVITILIVSNKHINEMIKNDHKKSE
ncbi:hypothetical protein BKN14_02695 [Candidatus Gracilibacteria bacterium HOT-871]|nr:hypothetical protein BKN14_02695 [Candidatus Gracilibacteria bacterium HOT-871]